MTPKRLILHIIGLALCVLPPAICTLTYFPIWSAQGGGKTLAGGAALLLTICALPLFKLVRRLIASHACYLVWLFCFVIFFALSRIAEEMTVISFAGLVGNLAGAVIMRIGERQTDEE